MKLISLGATVALAAFASSSPTGSQPSDGKELDWKYAVGWDGVTSPASAIGVPLTGNSTMLEVRGSRMLMTTMIPDS